MAHPSGFITSMGPSTRGEGFGAFVAVRRIIGVSGPIIGVSIDVQIEAFVVMESPTPSRPTAGGLGLGFSPNQIERITHGGGHPKGNFGRVHGPFYGHTQAAL